ncbi:MAG: GNAT family N-acetyltransferase [Actinocatenispora sp.]
MNNLESGVLREAQRQDLENIRRWRNHPRVREVSFTRHEITATEHGAWWARLADDETRRLLVFEWDGIPTGVVLFEKIHLNGVDPGARSASWGFYLDVDGLDERGIGLTAWLGVQREALDYAFGTLGVDMLTAEVLEDNTAVRRANRRFGFVEGPPAQRDVGDRTVQYRTISLRRDQRRATNRENA